MNIQDHGMIVEFSAQVAIIQVNNVSNISNLPTCDNCCVHCGGDHGSVNCQVDNCFSQLINAKNVNFVGNYQRQQNNLYFSTYNLRWRNHPNFV